MRFLKADRLQRGDVGRPAHEPGIADDKQSNREGKTGPSTSPSSKRIGNSVNPELPQRLASPTSSLFERMSLSPRPRTSGLTEGISSNSKPTMQKQPAISSFESVVQSRPLSPSIQKIAAEPFEAEAIKSYMERKKLGILLPTDHSLVATSNEILTKLLPSLAELNPRVNDWQCEVNVEHDDWLVNAYALPTGKVMLTSAMAEELKLTEGELAGFIAHEMVHSALEHQREKAVMREELKSQNGRPSGLKAEFKKASLSLSHEKEADRIGAHVMAQGGFDPKEMISALQKLDRWKKSNNFPNDPLEHPATSERVRIVKTEIKKMQSS